MGYAQELGLDTAMFELDLESAELAQMIKDDEALASKLGTNGTPAFFINGRFISGAQPFETFAALVDEEKAKAQKLVDAGTPRARSTRRSWPTPKRSPEPDHGRARRHREASRVDAPGAVTRLGIVAYLVFVALGACSCSCSRPRSRPALRPRAPAPCRSLEPEPRAGPAPPAVHRPGPRRPARSRSPTSPASSSSSTSGPRGASRASASGRSSTASPSASPAATRS
jgi:hypothetical protein